MKINFKQKLNQNPEHLIRRCGYGLVRDPRATEISYSRRLGGGIYPRFHLYINSADPLVLNLHLDQKQASYEGFTAHSGDYDSDLVKQEGQRIYNAIMNEADSQMVRQAHHDSSAAGVDEKKGFFSRLFGK